MSRIAQKVRRLEVTRAIKAAVDAHVNVAGAEIKPDGTLSLVFGPPQAALPSETNEEVTL